MQLHGRKKRNWKFIIIGLTLLAFSGCAKSKVDQNNDLGSGSKADLPISLDLLIEHAEYCKNIYDSGGSEKDNVAFDVKQDGGITIIVIRGTANVENVQSDIDVRLVTDDDLGIRLHKGFRDASISVMSGIDESSLEKTVHVTGHSLGGAIAQIIGMWLHKRVTMFKSFLTDHQKSVMKLCLVDNPLIGVWFVLAILSLLLLCGLMLTQDFL